MSMTPDIVFGSNRYVEYHPGSLNLILTIPHGGRSKPKSIPDRDAGAFIKGRVTYDHKFHKHKDPQNYPVRFKSDLNTIELGTVASIELGKLLGRRPHVVICNLHRCKLDCNSDIEKATFNVPEAKQAWYDFHNFIQAAKDTFSNGGLLLDIHGHTHPEGLVELGYTLTGDQLDSCHFSANTSSISHLSQRHSSVDTSDVASQKLIWGPQSLGGLLSAEGYACVPSPDHPGPRGCRYYTGGYNTEHHGSKYGGQVDAIQIESPEWTRRRGNVEEYAKALARGTQKYLTRYYNLDNHDNPIQASSHSSSCTSSAI